MSEKEKLTSNQQSKPRGGYSVGSPALFDDMNTINEQPEESLRNLMRLARQSSRSSDAIRLAQAYINAENALSMNYRKIWKDKVLPPHHAAAQQDNESRHHLYRPSLWTQLKELLLLGLLRSHLKKTQKREFALSQKNQDSFVARLLGLGEGLNYSS